MMSWKTAEFKDVPPEILAKREQMDVEEHKVTLTISGRQVNIFYREVSGGNTPVLFLHGAAFKSQTWLDLGTLALVGAMGHRAVALDLPGYGNSPSSDMNPADFIRAFMESTSLDKPVIVSPSMSGGYSLPYLMNDPEKMDQKVSGFVPIAPVSTGSFSRSQYSKVSIPVMIIYGSRDTNLGSTSLKHLSGCSNCRVQRFEDAGHACYMNRPDLWHKALFNYLTMI